MTLANLPSLLWFSSSEFQKKKEKGLSCPASPREPQWWHNCGACVKKAPLSAANTLQLQQVACSQHELHAVMGACTGENPLRGLCWCCCLLTIFLASLLWMLLSLVWCSGCADIVSVNVQSKLELSREGGSWASLQTLLAPRNNVESSLGVNGQHHQPALL